MSNMSRLNCSSQLTNQCYQTATFKDYNDNADDKTTTIDKQGSDSIETTTSYHNLQNGNANCDESDQATYSLGDLLSIS